MDDIEARAFFKEVYDSAVLIAEREARQDIDAAIRNGSLHDMWHPYFTDEQRSAIREYYVKQELRALRSRLLSPGNI